MILSKVTYSAFHTFWGIKPMTLTLLVSCPRSWATRTQCTVCTQFGVLCTSHCAAVTFHTWLCTLTFKAAVNSQFSGWKRQSALCRSVRCLLLRMLRWRRWRRDSFVKCCRHGYGEESDISGTHSKHFANQNALGQLTNQYFRRRASGKQWNKIMCFWNNQSSVETYSRTPQKPNQDFKRA